MKKFASKGKVFLLLGVGVVLVGGLYLRGMRPSEFKKLMEESVLKKFEPGTEFFLKIDDESYNILPEALDLSEVLRTAAGVTEAKDGKVELDLGLLFFGRAAQDENIDPKDIKQQFVDWGENVAPQDIRQFVDLLQAVAKATSPKTVDLSKFQKINLEQLSKLIMLVEFFGATKTKLFIEFFDELIALFAKKIKPDLTDKNISDFFAGEENILSKIVDGLPEGPSRILVDKLFAGERVKTLDVPGDVYVVVALSGERVAVKFEKEDGLLKWGIWNTSTGKMLRWLSDLNVFVREFVALPGERVAVNIEDKKVGIWNTSTGQMVEMLDIPTKYMVDEIFALPEERVVVNFEWLGHNRVGIWNTSTGQKVKILEGIRLLRDVVALSGERLVGRFFEHGSIVGKAGILNTSTGKMVEALDVPGEVEKLFGLSKGRVAVEFQEDGVYKVGIWNTSTGKQLQTLDVPGDVFEVVALSGERVAVNFKKEDGLLKWGIWNTSTGKQLKTLDVPGSASKLVVLSKGRVAVKFCKGKDCKEYGVGIWNTLTGRRVKILNVPGSVHDIIALAKGGVAVKFSEDNVYKIGIFDLFSIYNLYKDLNVEQALLVKYLIDQKRADKEVVETDKFGEIYESLPMRTTKLLHELGLYFSEFEELILDKPEPSEYEFI